MPDFIQSESVLIGYQRARPGPLGVLRFTRTNCETGAAQTLYALIDADGEYVAAMLERWPRIDLPHNALGVAPGFATWRKERA